ncbi:MAG: hypothetical protein KR126chlam2_00507 [Chlamydiae bacterium]|nr:hypothetical protein [Chlamydiota bacterium]
MKRILPLLLLCTSALFAQKAPFASQSDLVADVSDTLMGGIYHHRLGFESFAYERSAWVQMLGNYRERDSSSQRGHYENWFGGVVGGINYGLCQDSYLNFYLGGTWGNVDMYHSNFDTESIFFGMSYEKVCDRAFFGFALAGGYLAEERHYQGVREEPRGLFVTPEVTYANQLCYRYLSPIFSATLRYAGFFPSDYEHGEIQGILYVQKRSIQLVSLRGEVATAPFACGRCLRLFHYLQSYLGVSGRFQFDGNHVSGQLLGNRESFSQGVDRSIVYGMVGLRALKRCACTDLQASIEGNYDSDSSWRVYGEFSLNYAF